MIDQRAGLGHPGPLDGEIQRLSLLRDGLRAGADDVDRLPLESWRGTASETFVNVQGCLAKGWRAVADICDDGVRALEDYRDTIVEIRHRAPVPDGSSAWHELQPAAEAVARRLRELNTKLPALRSLFEEQLHPQGSPQPELPEPSRERPLAPPDGYTLGAPGDSSYTNHLAEVSNEFVDADFDDSDGRDGHGGHHFPRLPLRFRRRHE